MNDVYIIFVFDNQLGNYSIVQRDEQNQNYNSTQKVPVDAVDRLSAFYLSEI